MRRSVLIAVLVGALVGLSVAAAISLASGSSSSSSKQSSSATPQQGSFQSAYAAKRGHRTRGGGRRGGRRHGHGHGMGFGPLMLAFSGLADRLHVSTDDLHKAAEGVKKRALDRAVADGTITQDERAALEACFQSHHGQGNGSGCDRAKAKAAHRKLHKALRQRLKTDAAGLKAQLIGDLAAELGKPPAEVDAAARATLSDLLDKGVSLGFVTAKARDLALACWDNPNQCDRKALRAEFRKHFRGHGRRGGHHGRHP